MLQVHPSNPFRPVNWRWELARIACDKNKRKVNGVSDDYFRSAMSFQKGLTTCKDELDRWDLLDKYPDIYSAYLIYSRGESEERHPLRYVIEARILAGQDNYDIAKSTALTLHTVNSYEKIFFDVKDKLDKKDYVLSCIIGPSIHAGLSDRDYDLLWKLYGYLYGPRMLDALIYTTTKLYKPESLDEVNTLLAEDARTSIQRKVAIVARTFSVNPFSQSELLNLYARLLETERASGNEKPQDVIMQNIKVMMTSLGDQFEFGHSKNDSNLIEYDNESAELSSNELAKLSAGKKLEYIDNLKNIRFPEPVIHEQKNK